MPMLIRQIVSLIPLREGEWLRYTLSNHRLPNITYVTCKKNITTYKDSNPIVSLENSPIFVVNVRQTKNL